jgi:putative two-component system response regulator
MRGALAIMNTRRMEVLIAEDEPVSAIVLQEALQANGYDVILAENGREAFDTLKKSTCRLVISDWEMPEADGLEFCRAVRAEDLGRYIYIILLTGREGTRNAIEALSAGADDFLSKPVEPAELTMRLRAAQRILALETRDLALFALARLAESRDYETGEHLERVRAYAQILADDLAGQGTYGIDEEFVKLMHQTSPLHDIGKVAIPDHVLLKPGRLDPEEFEIMKTHAEEGARTLTVALDQFPEAEFLRMARDIALYHHERFDGKGYPQGLAGDAIPLCARIFAVADVYDALVAKRVYKAAYSHEVAKKIMLQGRGSQFDPAVVDAFLRCENVIRTVKERDTQTVAEEEAAV